MSLLDALLTGSGGSPLGGAAPPAVSANIEGVSTSAARRDHTHAHGSLGGGSQHSAATTGAAGFLSATDKTNNDTVWSSVAYLKPSGDVTGATDAAAIIAAIAANKCVVLLPGDFYTNAEIDFVGTRGLRLHGSGVTLTRLNYVGTRVAGNAVVKANNAQSLDIRWIDFICGQAEWGIYSNLTGGQPTNIKVSQCRFLGTNTVVATTATSLSATLGAKTITGTATTAFPLNTTIWFGSRGSRSWMRGTVTSSSGTLAVSITEAYDARMTGGPTLTFLEVGGTGDTITRSTGSWISDGFIAGDTITVAGSVSNNVTGPIASLSAATITLGSTDLVNETAASCSVAVTTPRTDWDIRQVPDGIFLGGNATSLVEQCTFGYTASVASLHGCYQTTVRQCVYSSGGLFGVPFTLGSSSTNCKLEVVTEPSFQGWQTTVKAGEVANLRVAFCTGDPGIYGSYIELDGGSSVYITGAMTSGSGCPLIDANGTLRLMIEGCHVSTGGSYLVDFGNASYNIGPIIRGNFFSDAPLGSYTGPAVSGYYWLENVSGLPDIAESYNNVLTSAYATVINTLTVGNGSTTGAKITAALGFQTYMLVGDRCTTLPLVNGSNADSYCGATNVVIVNPNAAFQLHGTQNYLLGERHRVRVGVAQVFTLKHNSGTATQTYRRFSCPGGVDLVSDGTTDAVYDIVHNGTTITSGTWDVHPISGFTPMAANQNLGFSATLAALTGETKTATLSCNSAVGDSLVCNPRAALPDGVTMHAWISSANTASVRMFNANAGVTDLSTVALDLKVVRS